MTAADLLARTGAHSLDSLTCPPRWATRRTPGRPTYGPRLAEISARMGRPFLPWQHVVADTAMEVDPDTGRLVYGIVVLTLPRQQGKTSLIVPLMCHRCLAWDRQYAVYAAQTRDMAREKLINDHAPMLAASPYGDRYELFQGMNVERLAFDNGSTWTIQATTPKSGHGPTIDLGVADEAWALKDSRLDQAWLPAMMTRDSQMWLPSTVGTIDSEYFHGKMDMGRDAAESGLNRDICYFEWSADPAADPLDPRTWWTCMPALGHTITEAKVSQARLAMDDPTDFPRAYCNQRPDDNRGTAVVDLDLWRSLADGRSRTGYPIAFGVEVAVDRSSASVGVASRRPDGRLHVEIIKMDPGVDWVVPYLVDRVRRHHPVAVGIDLGGPAGSLRQRIRRAPASANLAQWAPSMDAREADGALLTVPNVRELAQASGDLYDMIGSGELVWLGEDKQPALNRAVASAGQRPLGDAWAWARRGNAEVHPLVAVTLAAWALFVRDGVYDRSDYDVADSVW